MTETNETTDGGAQTDAETTTFDPTTYKVLGELSDATGTGVLGA